MVGFIIAIFALNHMLAYMAPFMYSNSLRFSTGPSGSYTLMLFIVWYVFVSMKYSVGVPSLKMRLFPS